MQYYLHFYDFDLWFLEEVLKKVKKLKYTEEDLYNFYYYIQNYAPLIIHFDAKKHLPLYMKDTHYRNGFEVPAGGRGRYRIEKEDCLFDSIYAKASSF